MEEEEGPLPPPSPSSHFHGVFRLLSPSALLHPPATGGGTEGRTARGRLQREEGGAFKGPVAAAAADDDERREGAAAPGREVRGSRKRGLFSTHAHTFSPFGSPGADDDVRARSPPKRQKGEGRGTALHRSFVRFALTMCQIAAAAQSDNSDESVLNLRRGLSRLTPSRKSVVCTCGFSQTLEKTTLTLAGVILF